MFRRLSRYGAEFVPHDPGVAIRIVPGELQCRLALGDVRLRFVDRKDKALPIDDAQYVALRDLLVVDDVDCGDQPGNIRGDFDNIGLHPRIPRPGRQRVEVPQPPADDYRRRHGDKADEDA